MKTAIILFAHGARDPEWANPMRRVQAVIRQRTGAMPVELAFLEFMAPSLPDCVDKLIAGGAEKIVIVPMFIARGGHLKTDVPLLLDRLRSTYPKVDISLNGPVGEHEGVIEAMAAAALEVAGLPIAW